MTHETLEFTPFPAVSVCYPLTLLKGEVLIQAITLMDKDEQILDRINDWWSLNDFRDHLMNRITLAAKNFRKTVDFNDNLIGNRSYQMFGRLLGSDLEEIGYLIHFLNFHVIKSLVSMNEQFHSGIDAGLKSMVGNVTDSYHKLAFERASISKMNEELKALLCGYSIDILNIQSLCTDWTASKSSSGNFTGVDLYCKSETIKVNTKHTQSRFQQFVTKFLYLAYSGRLV